MANLDWPYAAQALWEIYDAGGPRPEYLIPILARESSLQPNASNGAYHGLNQVGTDYLASRGISVDDYLKWPASSQLRRIVKPFLMIHAAQFGPMRSGIRTYQMNYLPATVRDGMTDLDDVLVTNKSPLYNGGLDWNHDGKITVGDLAFVVHDLLVNTTTTKLGPIVQDAIARTYEVRPEERIHDPVYGEDYPQPYLVGSYADQALSIAEMLAKGLSRLFRKKAP
jgi:hypothetical protein